MATCSKFLVPFRLSSHSWKSQPSHILVKLFFWQKWILCTEQPLRGDGWVLRTVITSWVNCWSSVWKLTVARDSPFPIVNSPIRGEDMKLVRSFEHVFFCFFCCRHAVTRRKHECSFCWEKKKKSIPVCSGKTCSMMPLCAKVQPPLTLVFHSSWKLWEPVCDDLRSRV